LLIKGFNAGPQFRTRNHRQRQQQQDTTPAGVSATFLQLLPVIMLFLMTAITMFTSEEEPYSFQKTYHYSQQKYTYPHDVSYYVQPKDYARRYNTERKRDSLNNQVESDVIVVYVVSSPNKNEMRPRTRNSIVLYP
jgi:hypothetical protein